MVRDRSWAEMSEIAEIRDSCNLFRYNVMNCNFGSNLVEKNAISNEQNNEVR